MSIGMKSMKRVFALLLAFCVTWPALADTFPVEITDPKSLAGITWARTQYNAALPKDAAGVVIGSLTTDAAYVSWVMTQAAASYAQQRAAAGVVDAVKAADEGDLTKLDAVRSDYAARPARGR